MLDSGPSRRLVTDDVIILGGGLAGLFCALRLAPRPVTILATAPLGEGASSVWAQGGIAAAVAPGDSIEKHLADTVAAGAGIVDEEIARLMVEAAPERVRDLLRFGVPFDRDLEGHLALSREGAHSERRVVHVRGDMAGAAIMAALVEAVRRTPSIRMFNGLVGESLATERSKVIGVVARARGGGRAFHYPARALILATGGIGRLYAVTTNPQESEGAGVGMAARAGAVIADPEFIQFHPTAIAVGRDPAPLASEAIRGDGAILVDASGRRFMPGLHPGAELAPRDVVARAIHAEIAAGRGAFLDCREALGSGFAERFPTVFASCRDAGLDPACEPIPVAPAEHFHMGGVLTDSNGRATLEGLWACGEVASTGAHGANRLASNSLLEAVVFAARVAADVRERCPEPASVERVESVPGPPLVEDRDEATALHELRETMSAKVGVVRDRSGLLEALALVEHLADQPHSQRFDNMLVTARLIIVAAQARTESRGGHFRSDFPEVDPAWKHRTLITLADRQPTTIGQPLGIEHHLSR